MHGVKVHCIQGIVYKMGIMLKKKLCTVICVFREISKKSYKCHTYVQMSYIRTNVCRYVHTRGGFLLVRPESGELVVVATGGSTHPPGHFDTCAEASHASTNT